MIYESASQSIGDVLKLCQDIENSFSQDQLKEAKKQLYFWQRNVDNNEKQLRQILDAPMRS